jgi:hypothetical protein
MLPARPGHAHGRLSCGIACSSAFCSCCRGWMVLRVLLCAELMFWLCCLVGFLCCNKNVYVYNTRRIQPASLYIAQPYICVIWEPHLMKLLRGTPAHCSGGVLAIEKKICDSCSCCLSRRRICENFHLTLETMIQEQQPSFQW